MLNNEPATWTLFRIQVYEYSEIGYYKVRCYCDFYTKDKQEIEQAQRTTKRARELSQLLHTARWKKLGLETQECRQMFIIVNEIDKVTHPNINVLSCADFESIKMMRSKSDLKAT